MLATTTTRPRMNTVVVFMNLILVGVIQAPGRSDETAAAADLSVQAKSAEDLRSDRREHDRQW
jgi:hypothetical protein